MKVDFEFLLFHFKSEFCPFNKIPHDKYSCVYAHNWQDFKRPYRNKLINKVCKHWVKDQGLESYERGCPFGYECDYCHGWKEKDYHLQNLKRV